MKIEHYMYQNYNDYWSFISDGLKYPDKVLECLRCIIDGCKEYSHELPSISSIQAYDEVIFHAQKQYKYIRVEIEVERDKGFNVCKNQLDAVYAIDSWESFPPITYVTLMRDLQNSWNGLRVYFKNQ